MHLNRCTLEANEVDLDVNDIVFLKRRKDRIEHAALCPAVGSHADAVPSPKVLRKGSPFAALLGDIQNGVKCLNVIILLCPSRFGEQGGDEFVLCFRECHSAIV